VLARKYRPAAFDTLLGQQAMVQTLANAIARGRLAQAWLLTGVRGVGKTSTARIIAKALNCIGTDGSGGPTITPCGQCVHCTAIAAGNHMDVVELDAASNTSIDDMREIIDSVRYAAVSARFKVHIIDEVHMLSKSAFNALLKTLEEPPAGVKFILATTEVNKVPATILSRCQRFDLRRVPADLLRSHFADILGREGVGFEPEAVALVAAAAEGSVRDGLSILDQAIAHGGDRVTAAAVRDMLGLADRGAVRMLMGHVLEGRVPAMLDALARHYDLGVDPAQLVRELLALVHAITRQRMAPRPDPALSAEEQAALDNWAQALTFPRLSMLWQLLLKGLAEVEMAPVPLQAAEMLLLRLCHAADLPDPAALVKQMEAGGGAPAPVHPIAPSPAPPAPVATSHAPEPVCAPADFAALVGMVRDARQALLAHSLAHDVRLVEWAPPRLVLSAPALSADMRGQIGRAIAGLGGIDWQLAWSDDTMEAAGPTLREIEQADRAALEARVRSHPTVAAALAAFPDAALQPPHLSRSA
jgi:DNA polymerase-3 subunit gamma/tau